VFACPLLAIALDWIVTDVDRYASMDSAEAWKRELDNLQMAYVSPSRRARMRENLLRSFMCLNMLPRSYVVLDNLLSGRT